MPIKEFSKVTGLTESALRRFDKEGIFKPSKLDEKNHYRYYDPTQIITAKMIHVLINVGISLTDIKELTHERSPVELLKRLTKQRNIVDEKLNVLTEGRSTINIFLSSLVEGLSAIENDITVIKMCERKIVLGDENDFGNDSDFYNGFTKYCNSMRERNVNLAYPVGGFFENMEAFIKNPSKPTRFFSINPSGNDKRKEGFYLVGYTRGYYGQTNGLENKMSFYAQNNGIALSGPVYNIYPLDEISTIDSNNYLLQVAATVKETF